MSDLEFLHVTAKRILNHVPSGSRAPTNWTINVYRGCSHACTYCLSGETPILMADGRSKPLAEIRPGDRVYGTERRGTYRHYVPTEVLDHWQTVKPAYRVTLEDGTKLIASGEHRFLTDRGYKHVAPDSSTGQRPHLTPNNHLLGIGHLALPPQHDDDYVRGYLTGMIRGDANLATYPVPAPWTHPRRRPPLQTRVGRPRATRPHSRIPQSLRSADDDFPVLTGDGNATSDHGDQDITGFEGAAHQGPNRLAPCSDGSMAEGISGGNFRRRGESQSGCTAHRQCERDDLETDRRMR